MTPPTWPDYYVALEEDDRTYYVRKEFYERWLDSHEPDSTFRQSNSRLMYACDFVAARRTDIKYYDVDGQKETPLFQLVKNRFGENGILVTQAWLHKALLTQGLISKATSDIWKKSGLVSG